MDRLIAPNSVPLAQADVAPSTGTPQYATDGNPATGVPATLWPAYAWNAMQEELIAVLTGAGIAPDRTNNALLLASILKLIGQPQTNKVSGVVGQVRNFAMSVPAASASATATADEIIVETALGGTRYCLTSFNKTINLATTGAGGMDTGTAPVSGFVVLYAIWNPTTQTAALLATNAMTAVQPNVYGGANMPSGYTASALVGVWPTNASSQFVAGYQVDRAFSMPFAVAASTSTQVTSLTAVSVASLVPKNARSITGFMNVSGTNATNTAVNVASSAAGINQQQCVSAGPNAGTLIGSATFGKLPIIISQTLYWQTLVQAGTFVAANVFICGYDF